jgi:hypothetical protein
VEVPAAVGRRLQVARSYLVPSFPHFDVKKAMPGNISSKERIAEFRKVMSEMATARLDIFSTNATKYAEALGAFRAALEKSGFSDEESMQIVLKVVEQPGRPMFRGGHVGPWRKG